MCETELNTNQHAKYLDATVDANMERKSIHISICNIYGVLGTGMEPHSALPVAMPMVFSDHCDQLPQGLKGIKILAHTAVSNQQLL